MQEEKKPMTKAQYLGKMKSLKQLQERVIQDPHRLRYHLQPPVGWLNDPNGLCQIGDTYHIYFQYTPFNPKGGCGLWGHMTTKDFLHYEECEPSIFPDSSWDANGAYSGSAFEKEGTFYFFYTGNVKHEDKEYDYAREGKEQNVILTTTVDGINFTEKKLIMTNDDYPMDMSRHVRDPQVVYRNGRYYMLQGARDLSERGSVLLFESIDLLQWKYKLRFTSKERFGYMWECPNFVEMEGQQFLIVCPQGVESQGYDYANANQCGYFPLSYNFGEETYEIGAFHQLDRGFDFYAPQILKDHQGRILLIGWMGMPEASYNNQPTVDRGWQHGLTIPRELYLTARGQLAQKPVEELKKLRTKERVLSFHSVFQIDVPVCFELILKIQKTEDFQLKIRESAVLSYKDGVLCLDIEPCGSGRTQRYIFLSEIHAIQILSDVSSLEIFLNDGEEVFTTRIYDSMKNLHCELNSQNLSGSLHCYALG